MSVFEGGGSSGLVRRVQDILLRPAATWEKIDTEAATIRGLFTGYIVILAAIGPVSQFLGGLLFGGFLFGPASLAGAIVGYGLALVATYVMALVIDALAPSFGGQKNPVQAMKVSAYSGTAAWLAGIFQLAPMLAWLGIVGLYSLYLLYLGLPRLMKAPADKALGYTAVVVVVMILVYAVIGGVVVSITGRGAMGAMGAATMASAMN